jgi:hypothetical protein
VPTGGRCLAADRRGGWSAPRQVPRLIARAEGLPVHIGQRLDVRCHHGRDYGRQIPDRHWDMQWAAILSATEQPTCESHTRVGTSQRGQACSLSGWIRRPQLGALPPRLLPTGSVSLSDARPSLTPESPAFSTRSSKSLLLATSDQKNHQEDPE